MTYLITGGCGFIGVNFAKKLLERGDKVIIVDNLSRKGSDLNLRYLKENFSTGFEFYQLSLGFNISSDQQKLHQLVEKSDVIYHLAGQVAVTTSILDPKADFLSNTYGTLDILEAVRNSQKKPMLIYASTNKVYGRMSEIGVEEKEKRFEYRNLPLGISETQCLDFHSPYGCSKGAADQYVRDYARIYGLRTVVMRQSCIYGPRQFGVEDQGWVAWFAIAALLGKKITIYGNGKQVRDILYVDDLFEAWQMIEEKIEIATGQIFNVGGGSNMSLSLLELLEMLEKKYGKKINVDFADWRAGDQPIYISNVEKINHMIGWRPRTEVSLGLNHLMKWLENDFFQN